MATIEINTEDFEDTITDNDIVLVDFWAEWCGPCKRFGPIYEKTSEEYQGVVFAKLDTEANQELSGQLGIEGIPTLMAFREGVLVFNQAGALPAPALKQGALGSWTFEASQNCHEDAKNTKTATKGRGRRDHAVLPSLAGFWNIPTSSFS